MVIYDLITHGTIYALAGALTGLVSGMFGIGGGVVVVPALVYVFSHHIMVTPDRVMHMAAATSLASMVFTSQSTVRAYMRRDDLLWSYYMKMVTGIIIGTILGVSVAHYVPNQVLKVIFGFFLLVVAAEMIINFKLERPKRNPPWWFHSSVSSLIGFKSGMLGVGGGVVVIPYLNWCGVSARQIAAISALCTMTVASIGTLSFILNGWYLSGLPPYATGYVYWPAVLLIALPSMFFAPVGAKIGFNMPVEKLKAAFTLVLIFIAIDFIV